MQKKFDSSNVALPTEDEHFHPLELIPYFRRQHHSRLRDILYTIIFSTAIGLGFVVLNIMTHHFRSFGEFAEMAWQNVVVSNVIGFVFHISYNALGSLLNRINRFTFPGMVLSYTLISTAVVQVGGFITSFLPGYGDILSFMVTLQWFTTSLVVSFFISLVIGLAWRAKIGGLTRAAELAHERERLEIAERAAAEANLRALQAQIEPHFLFNTLANVVSLIDPAPDKARQMLQDFIEYLRASLAATRAQRSTLGREAEMMRAFLRLIKIRMGDRLEFSVDVPAELADASFPPMLLQPLIENAVKHGLESKIEGGFIRVSAERLGDHIQLTVEDSGLGFQGESQSGMGLSNVSERLAALFGPAVHLNIENREPSGTRIAFQVPLTAADARQTASNSVKATA
jgi:sensor histidine kinase YesM